MKTIGVIGGMSWESTVEYLQQFNRAVRERLGGLHSAKLRVATVDFEEIAVLQRAGRWDEAGEALAQEARDLEAAGADVLLIATNTMHLVYDQVQRAVSVPVLHIADVTAEAIREQGLTKVALLATRYTMEQSFYVDRLAQHGVDAMIPAQESDREQVQRIIFDELCVGLVTDTGRQELKRIGDELVRQGAQGVILGCTELELSASQRDFDVPVFPTTTLHCQAALAFAQEGQPS